MQCGWAWIFTVLQTVKAVPDLFMFTGCRPLTSEARTVPELATGASALTSTLNCSCHYTYSPPDKDRDLKRQTCDST